MHILIVDDYDANVLVVSHMLEAIGHTDISAAGSGQEALDVLDTGNVDVVLMDLGLPDIDGLMVTKQIRQKELDQSLPRVKIIGVTARAQMEDRERCLTGGMDDYLSKPFSIDGLKKVLQG